MLCQQLGQVCLAHQLRPLLPSLLPSTAQPQGLHQVGTSAMTSDIDHSTAQATEKQLTTPQSSCDIKTNPKSIRELAKLRFEVKNGSIIASTFKATEAGAADLKAPRVSAEVEIVWQNRQTGKQSRLPWKTAKQKIL